MVYDLDSIKQRNPIADVIAAHGVALRVSGAHLAAPLRMKLAPYFMRPGR